MLKSLRLRNFRGFNNHALDFKDISVIVGMNNAGKSTIVDALRLLAITTQRFRLLRFTEPPEWTGLRPENWGVSPSLENLNINFQTIFYQYGEPPAQLTADFVNGTRVDLFIGPSTIFALIYTPTGRLVVNRWLANDTDIPGIAILPQIGPVREVEPLLMRENVQRNIFSSRFSPQFRNHIYHNQDCLNAFRQLIEVTWPRVRVLDIKLIPDGARQRLYLEVRNEAFVGELFVMGHGLQMWMQAVWFIARFPRESTLILDEPDVYMHPDLQRRMCKYLFRHARTYPQVIITTHSVEIMSEVSADQIVVIDKRQSRSIYAADLTEHQAILDRIGSVHNVHLARLNWARRFFIVEGEDIKILSAIHSTMFPESELSLDATPQIRTGGWGGWGNAIGAHQSISESSGQSVKVYVIFDSDYHTTEEIEERYDQANKCHMNLHIWGQKEIENYLIHTSTIYRLLIKRAKDEHKRNIAEKEVKKKIGEIIESMSEDVCDQIANESLKRFKYNVATANKYAREVVGKARKSQYGLSSVVSGKKLISALSEWTNREYGVSFGPLAIARELYVNEIPDEMKDLLSKIESGEDLNASL